MGRLMRRQESRRGAMVTGDADREGCSPEKTASERVDDLQASADNSTHSERKGELVLPLPGF